LRFYTYDECQDWLKARGGKLPPRVGLNREVVRIPYEVTSLLAFSRLVARSMQGYMGRVLFWLTDWNDDDYVYLYYQLRQSYGDRQLIEDAPGHLFLPQETEALTSFLFLAIAHYWEGYLLEVHDYVSAFLTNDECIDFFSSQKGNLEFVSQLRRLSPETGGPDREP
jgi:hypothetical protein